MFKQAPYFKDVNMLKKLELNLLQKILPWPGVEISCIPYKRSKPLDYRGQGSLMVQDACTYVYKISFKS